MVLSGNGSMSSFLSVVYRAVVWSRVEERYILVALPLWQNKEGGEQKKPGLWKFAPVVSRGFLLISYDAYYM